MTPTNHRSPASPPSDAGARSGVRRTVLVLVLVALGLYGSLFVRAWLLSP
jgi:hypothetical protein